LRSTPGGPRHDHNLNSYEMAGNDGNKKFSNLGASTASVALDIEIVNGLKRGYLPSLNRLHQLFYSPLCTFAQKLIHNKEEAEDISTAAFLKFWEIRDRFDTMGKIKKYMYVCTRNACINYLRDLNRRIDNQDKLLYLAETQEDFVENNMIRAELLLHVKEEIDLLPAGCQQVCRLIMQEGLTTREIADRLNISEANVRVQKAKAISLIRVSLIRKRLLPLLLFLLIAWELFGRVFSFPKTR
jgi:RNA polymerase sigma-70 factor (family 1)